MKKILAALLMTAGLLALTTAARADEHSAIWTGVDFGPGSEIYGYLGGVTALSGQSIHDQGFQLRASGGYGRSRYDSTLSPSGEFTDRVTDGDLMVGYHALSGPASASVYIGGNIANHRDSPFNDPSSHHGTRAGFKTQMEMSTFLYEKLGLNAMGSYSTTFRTYWSRIDAPYHFGWFSIGPEVGFSGDMDYNQFRYGGAISDIKLGRVNLRVDGGGALNNGNGKDGAYGGASIGTAF